VTEVIQFAVLGLGISAVYVLLVQGLLVIYSGSGVLNFAHGAMAMVAAYLYWEVRLYGGYSILEAYLLCIGVMARSGRPPTWS